VEGIISRVPAETLQQIYSVPPFASAAEFLVMVALSRGRLGKVHSYPLRGTKF
jgi:nuclear GTP-binding protein